MKKTIKIDGLTYFAGTPEQVRRQVLGNLWKMLFIEAKIAKRQNRLTILVKEWDKSPEFIKAGLYGRMRVSAMIAATGPRFYHPFRTGRLSVQDPRIPRRKVKVLPLP